MNFENSKKRNKLLYVVAILLVVFSLTVFMTNSDFVSVYADEITAIETETYIVNFENGTEDIDAFEISVGDSYSLTQYGCTINNVYTEFTGREKMNNCAYGSYYGSPIINNVTVAMFTGWTINGVLLNNVGQWQDYETSVLTVKAQWTPITFSATFNDGYTENSEVETFNYFEGITLPEKIEMVMSLLVGKQAKA